MWNSCIKETVFLILLVASIYEAKKHYGEPVMSAIYTIEDNGYPAEVYTVVTDDGYKLTVHRIPFSPKKNVTINRIPVLLLHGFLGYSDSYLVLGQDRGGLCFLLADEGYDVWIGNTRGNVHSRRHVSLDPDKDKDFWNFSFHENGMYDVPSMIDYILRNTGQPKVHLIAHSQGNTATFAMLAEKPEYNNKVFSFSAYAPAVYVNHLSDPLCTLLKLFQDGIHMFSTILQVNELLIPGRNDVLQKNIGEVCSLPGFREICTALIIFENSFDAEQIETDLTPDIVVFWIGGASYKQIFHFTQLVNTGEFRKYDYKADNLEMYNQTKPPFYNLSEITAPIGLFHGENDHVAVMIDLERTASELKSLKLKYLVPYKKFSHHDFLIAKDAKSLVYDKTIEFMKEMEYDD